MKLGHPLSLLMSARNFFDDFRKLSGISDTMDRDEDQSEPVWKNGDTYFLFCSSGGPSSFHSSASFCIPRFSSLLRPSRVVVKASGYAARYVGVPAAAFDCLF